MKIIWKKTLTDSNNIMFVVLLILLIVMTVTIPILHRTSNATSSSNPLTLTVTSKYDTQAGYKVSAKRYLWERIAWGKFTVNVTPRVYTETKIGETITLSDFSPVELYYAADDRRTKDNVINSFDDPMVRFSINHNFILFLSYLLYILGLLICFVCSLICLITYYVYVEDNSIYSHNKIIEIEQSHLTILPRLTIPWTVGLIVYWIYYIAFC